MRSIVIPIASLLAVPLLASHGQSGAQEKAEDRIGPIMLKAHQPNKRQLYRALDQLVISGRATPEEKKRLVQLYEALATLKPPLGTAESWKRDVGELVAAAKAMANGNDGAAGQLAHAVDCSACHEKYRHRTRKPPRASKEQTAVKQLLERGGNHWSAPTKATFHGTEYLQGGRHLYIWPAEDRVYPSVRSGDGKVYNFGVKFNWMLQPGESIPPQTTGQYYHYAAVAQPKMFGWNFTRRFDEQAERGSFDVLLSLGADKLKGDQEVVFAIFVNARVAIPGSNFVKVRGRLPL
jgi:hypothetical protein